MREIKLIKVYNLVNSKGLKLQMNLGIITKGLHDEYPISTADKGERWNFVGSHIPMPVRSDYWFNGFPEKIMLDWLKGNGWALHTVVNVATGRVKVCELPSHNEASKGNEKPIIPGEYPIHHEQSRAAFEEVIRELYSAGRKITAVRVYRYAHGGTLYDANEAVKAICGKP